MSDLDWHRQMRKRIVNVKNSGMDRRFFFDAYVRHYNSSWSILLYTLYVILRVFYFEFCRSHIKFLYVVYFLVFLEFSVLFC